jgi:NAD(P)-dependent dehydrogenase (short-subunit alcohol dehydrogenase family)
MVAFISGANRGIGYEFTIQLLELGWHVVAGYRTEEKSKSLLEDAKKHDNLHPFRVDITDDNMLNELAAFIKQKFGRLDLLINNAAINPSRSDDVNHLNPEDISRTFHVDVMGPFLTTRHLYELLRKGKNPKLVNISSKAGLISVANQTSIPYRISKAALNMLTKIQAESYRRDNVIVIAMTPGWVRTDMGGSSARLAPEDSIAGMLKVIQGISMKDTGSFMSYEGERIGY